MRIGNRVTEKDLREWLTQNGWYGRSAEIDHVELHAVRRPGWEQVFRFSGRAKRKAAENADDSDRDEPQPADANRAGEWHTLWGAIHDDERFKANRPTIWAFESEDEQAAKLSKLSEELVVLNQGQSSKALLPTIAIVAAVITMACLVKLLAQ